MCTIVVENFVVFNDIAKLLVQLMVVWPFSIVRLSHLNSIQDFIGKGRDLERIVLSKAIKLHIERKVMVYKNKTIIFS